jgi:hypothetical protein
LLAYPNFLDTLNAIRPMMLFRVLGGGLYLIGWLLLAYNAYRTLRGAKAVNGTIEVFVADKPAEERLGLGLLGAHLCSGPVGVAGELAQGLHPGRRAGVGGWGRGSGRSGRARSLPFAQHR